MKINVQIHNIYNNENSHLKANASVAFGGQFAVHGVNVIEGKNGLFVQMPQRMSDDGEYYQVFHPITKDARNELNAAVLKQYDLKLAELANGIVEGEENTAGAPPEDEEQSEEFEEIEDDFEITMN